MLLSGFRKIILSLKGFRWATKFEKQTTVFLLLFPKVTEVPKHYTRLGFNVGRSVTRTVNG